MGNCLKYLICKKKYKTNSINNFCILLKVIFCKNVKNGIYNYKGLDKDYILEDFLFNKSFYIIFDTEKKLYYFNRKIIDNKIIKKLNYFYCGIENNKIEIKINQNKNNFVNKNSFWNVCYPYEYYDIKEGDIIKIGRIKLHFKSIVKDKLNLPETQAEEKINENDNSLINSEFDFNNNLKCRICLEPEIVDNRYIKTCKCYYNIPIHTKCFFMWMKNHIKNIKNEDYCYFEYKNLKCEICLENFPLEFEKKDGTKKSIFNLDNFDKPHTIIEIYEDDLLNIKGIYILFLNDNILKVGSSENNNLIFKNKTISHNHALIDIMEEKIRIKDLNSQYGTHFFVNDDIKVENLSYWNIQFNMFMLDFTFVKNISESEIKDCINILNLNINKFDDRNEFIKNDLSEKNIDYINIQNINELEDEILITNLTLGNKNHDLRINNEKEIKNKILTEDNTNKEIEKKEIIIIKKKNKTHKKSKSLINNPKLKLNNNENNNKFVENPININDLSF